MGNTHGKEARGGSRFGPGAGAEAGGSSGGAGYQGDLPDRSRRVSRAELAALGLPITGNSTSRRQDAPFEHRETRQEREARRLERERVARIKERDRSMREEHVDGGVPARRAHARRVRAMHARAQDELASELLDVTSISSERHPSL